MQSPSDENVLGTSVLSCNAMDAMVKPRQREMFGLKSALKPRPLPRPVSALAYENEFIRD